MVDAARDYGAEARFHLPSKSNASIGTSFASSATALSTTQIGMLDQQARQRRIRRVDHESKRGAQQIPTRVSAHEFHIYPIEEVSREK
jgi:hypothetical protein